MAWALAQCGKWGSGMNGHIVLGLFALYVAVISLGLVLTGRQDGLLLRLRQTWGRRCGHSLYFVLNVALPLLVCIVSLGWGVRHYDPEILVASLSTPYQLRLDVKSYQIQELFTPALNTVTPDQIIYGA